MVSIKAYILLTTCRYSLGWCTLLFSLFRCIYDKQSTQYMIAY